MTKALVVSCYVIMLSVIIVSVDIAFFRGHFWARLMANVGIVLVCAAFTLRFMKGLS
jgi:hypothetical protein